MTDTAIKPAPINHWLNGKLTPGTSGRRSPTAHREAETAKAHRG